MPKPKPTTSTTPQPQLVKGEQVSVFVDPLTETQLEGLASLITPHDAVPVNDDGTENWFVRFPDAPGKYLRRVRPPGVPKLELPPEPAIPATPAAE